MTEIKPEIYSNHQAAIHAILKFSDERLELAETAKPYVWNRAEIYEEREERWNRNSTCIHKAN